MVCRRDIRKRVKRWKITYPLVWFQFEFLRRRITTNDFISIICLKQMDSCSFCKDATGTLTHLFWNCNRTKIFWWQLHLRHKRPFLPRSFESWCYTTFSSLQHSVILYLIYKHIQKKKIWTRWKSKTNCEWFESHQIALNFGAFM